MGYMLGKESGLQLKLKGDPNDLRGVPETLKRRRSSVLRIRKTPLLFGCCVFVQTSLTGWILKRFFSISRLSPDFVVRLRSWKVVSRLQFALLIVSRQRWLVEILHPWQLFCLCNTVRKSPLVVFLLTKQKETSYLSFILLPNLKQPWNDKIILKTNA